MKDGSNIKGFGGKPGEIILTGQLSLDQSDIIGKATNKPSSITAKGISLSNDAQLMNFSETINVTGRETFRLESGGSIEKFSGTINSCAPLSMDGNTTEISFTEDAEMTIRARSLDLNNEAKIVCIGKSQEECLYNFVEQNCDVPPSADLNVKGSAAGKLPLTVEFTGNCDGSGTPVTCTINFGDGSGEQIFDGNVMHTYEQAGTFNAVLKATNAEGQTATSEKAITVTQEGGLPPATDVQFTISKQSVEKDGEISLNIDCNLEFQTFRVENDLGLPPITEPPESCPATLGPFKIPADAEAGSHSFTLLGKTAGNQIVNKTVSFTVEETQSILPDFLSGETMLYAGIAVIIVLVVLIVIVLLKRRSGRALSKKWGKPPAAKRGEKAAEEKTEIPPWIKREEPEAIQPKPAEKPSPQPAEPIIMGKPAAKPAQPEVEEAKPAIFVAETPAKPKAEKTRPESIGKPGPKPIEEPGLPAKPAETPKEKEPGDRFKKLVDMLKRSKVAQQPLEKKQPLPGPMPEQPAAMPKPVLKKTVLEKPAAIEKKPARPEKKPLPKPKKPVSQPTKPAAIKKPFPKPAVQEKPVAVKKQGAAPKILDLPTRKPTEEAKKEEVETVKKPEKKGFSLFRKKKKPAKEEEKPAEKERGEGELPSWLKKTQE
jgi:PKD repeat protein